MDPQPSILFGQLSISDLLLSASGLFAVATLSIAALVVFLVAEEFILFWRRTAARRPRQSGLRRV